MSKLNSTEQGISRKAATRKPASLILIWLIIIIAALLIVGGFSFGLTRMVCIGTRPIEGGALTTVRTIFVVIDPTESMSKKSNEAKKAVVSGKPLQPGPGNYAQVKEVIRRTILPQLGPGDYIEGYQISSSNESFDEGVNYIFGGVGSSPPLPEVQARIADETITMKDLDDKCAGGPALKEKLKKQWSTLDALTGSWNNQIDLVQSPVDKCCSAYIAAIDYLGRRLDSDRVRGEKWLVVVGDLLEESKTITPGSYTDSKAQTTIAFEPEEKERNRFRGVKVLMIRPSGPQDIKLRNTLDDLWREYFQSRGASKIEFLWFNDSSGLGKTKVPRV